MTLRKSAVALVPLMTTLVFQGCGSEPTGGIDPQPPSAVDAWPKWSPVDSTMIAYSHLSQNEEELEEFGMLSTWIVDLNSGMKRWISEGVVCDWTPDGTQIAVAMGGIHIVDVESGSSCSLTCGDSSCRHLAADFSSCGRWLTYINDGDPYRGIWKYDLATDESTWISYRYGADWFPNGNTILSDSLVVLDSAGVRLSKIDFEPERGYAQQCRWSPDGNQIAFVAQGPSGETGIWRIDSDGTNQEYLCDGASPSWSPGGTRIAFRALSADGSAGVIWTMRSDGSDRTQVTYP